MTSIHRCRRRLATGLAVLSLLAGLGAVTPPAEADPAAVPVESWVTNGVVYAVGQVGSRLYVGGSFTQAGPNTGFGVALDPSTGVWAPEFPKINGTVLVAVPDGAGGFYIGGDFTRVGPRSRHNGAHVVPGATAGTWDVAAWNPATDKPIRAIALSPTSNVAYIGGDFSVTQGVARAGIAAVNSFTGAPVLSFDPGAGTGTAPPPTSSTTTTPPVGPVAALAVSADGSRLYAGGFFTSMAGVARSGLAALDAATGALDAAFNPAPSAGGVEAMVLTASGRLLLGGGFTKIGATARNHLAAVTAATGALDAAWAPSADGAVHTLRLSADGTGVFAGGAFATIAGSARSRLALLSATGPGALDATWKPTADADVSPAISREVVTYLENPLVQSDSALMLRALIAKAVLDRNTNEIASRGPWEQILELARSLGDERWEGRAKAELGQILYMDGDVQSATTMLRDAIVSQYLRFDLGAAIHYTQR